MTPEEIDHQKDIEYYASSVDAWFNTSLEHDKSILTLATGGIGLLIALLPNVKLPAAEILVLYTGAIISFLVAIISILVVFRRNKTYIEQILVRKIAENDPVLAKADSIALWAFGFGAAFSAFIGIATVIYSHTSEEKVMAIEPKKSTQSVPLRENFNGATNRQFAHDSFNGVTSLQKSFNGASNLKPQPIASTTAPAPIVSTPVSTSSGTSQNQGGNGK